MLQLIGWLGCLYLLLKGVEFVASSGYRDSNGMLKGSAILASGLAWLGAAVFFFAFTMQTTTFPGSLALNETTVIEGEYPEKKREVA